MSEPRKLKLEQVVRITEAFEALGGNYPMPGGEKSGPLELATGTKWNIAKNLRILRAERDLYNEQVREIAREEIAKFYPSGKMPAEQDQTKQDRDNQRTIDAAYAPRMRELNSGATELAGLLAIPYAGLNVDKNKNFPLSILPDLLEFIDGEPSTS